LMNSSQWQSSHPMTCNLYSMQWQRIHIWHNPVGNVTHSRSQSCTCIYAGQSQREGMRSPHCWRCPKSTQDNLLCHQLELPKEWPACYENYKWRSWHYYQYDPRQQKNPDTTITWVEVTTGSEEHRLDTDMFHGYFLSSKNDPNFANRPRGSLQSLLANPQPSYIDGTKSPWCNEWKWQSFSGLISPWRSAGHYVPT
jgi:hypothetical protein